MRRRSFLASVAAVAGAGCTTRSPETDVVTTTDRPYIVTAGTVETKLMSITAVEEIRYYDEAADSLKFVEPGNDLWVLPVLNMENLGSESVPMDSLTNTRLRAGESVYAPVGKPPAEKIRPRGGNGVFENAGGSWPDGDVEPGITATAHPLFDTEMAEQFVVIWEFNGEEYELSV